MVANAPSTRSEVSARRVDRSSSLASRWSKATNSAKVEGTSASARPVWAECGVWAACASWKCMPCPSSWAIVSTSFIGPCSSASRRGEASWATGEQKAPPRLPGPRLGVDALLGEEGLRDRRHLRREAGERGVDERAAPRRSRPGGPRRAARTGRPAPARPGPACRPWRGTSAGPAGSAPRPRRASPAPRARPARCRGASAPSGRRRSCAAGRSRAGRATSES